MVVNQSEARISTEHGINYDTAYNSSVTEAELKSRACIPKRLAISDPDGQAMGCLL